MADAPAHTARIQSVIRAPDAPGGIEASWRRCTEMHRLDPGQRRRPQVLTAIELRSHVTELEPYRDIIEQGLFELFGFLGSSGYEVTFCNGRGVTTLTLSTTSKGYLPSLECPGSLWIEEAEGTNGIGTCLWEEKPISIYREQHFLKQYAGNSCAAAPLHSATGEVLGVFNIATRSASMSAGAHQVAFNVLVRMTAEIEQRLFRYHYKDLCLIEMLVSPGRLAFVATHDEGTVVAGDRHAQELLGLPNPRLEGKSIWQFFDRNRTLLQPLGTEAVTLFRTGSGARIKSRAIFPVRASRPVGVSDVAPKESRPLPPQREEGGLTLEEIAGRDPGMRRNVDLLRQTCDTSLPVLLLGETGTGKDVLARAIHTASARAARPFVAINCAAIPETLIDSELFGYLGGAFTGAKREGRRGRIADADRGTLFLDEIGDMPPGLQTRLLRFLENSEITPIGGGKVSHLDVKVIAATNVSIVRAIKEGRFRADLYYRLAGVAISLPPLCERSDFESVVSLVLRQLRRFPLLSLPDATIAKLRAHSWPGNIRELRNVLTRAACIASDGVMRPEHVFFDLEMNAGVASGEVDNQISSQHALATSSRERERALIISVLQKNENDVVAAAHALKVSRATLYRRLKELQISPGRARRIRIEP